MITRLRYDTTNTFVLSGGGAGVDAACLGVTYFPRTAELDMSIADEIERWENARVTEACEVVLAGTSAAIVAAVQAIEGILAKAQRRAYAVSGESAYVEYQSYSAASVYRSQLLDGRVVWSEEPALRRLPDSGETAVKIMIAWTRMGYWEGPETELQLSNTSNSGAAGTGGRTIYNQDTATTGTDNYVQIASSQIAGVAPAPVKVKLQNNTGVTESYRYIHLAVNALANPAMSHQIEGESAYVLSDGAIAADASSSGGQVWRVTGVSSVKRISFTLGATLMQQTLGRNFRLLGRFPASGTGVYAKITLRSGSDTGALLAETEETLLSGAYNIKDLGTLPLPPGGYNPSSDELWLVIELRAVSSQTVDLDFVQLFPTEAYRYITQRGETLASNDAIWDNMIDRPWQTYAEAIATGYRRSLYSTVGRLYVWPGKTQRILVLWTGASVTITDSFSVRVWYRPRVATV